MPSACWKAGYKPAVSKESRISARQLTCVDLEAAMEWRCLTVAHLTRGKEVFDESRTQKAVDRIMDWCISLLSVNMRRAAVHSLKQSLKEGVVKSAVNFSIALRRQYGLARVCIPITLHDQSQKWLAAGQGSLLEVFVRPQLRRQSVLSMTERGSWVDLCEAELIQILNCSTDCYVCESQS